MTSYLLLLLLMIQIYKASNLPNNMKRSSKDMILNHVEPNAIPAPTIRKKKGPTITSLQIQHQLYVPNLHVIPLANVQHSNVGQNVTHPLIQVLIPIHNLVPVHDLTVIPLHRVSEQKISYRLNDEEDRYRNPLGGYGVGWRFGGHGAGHGFHYLYG